MRIGFWPRSLVTDGMINGKMHGVWMLIRVQLEESLKALRRDYLDLYQFHSGSDEDFDNDDLWTMLDKQVQAGKILKLGDFNWQQ